MTAREDHSDDTALAGEYVLRLLDADERKAFELRLGQESALCSLVRDWEDQLAWLASSIPPVTQPLTIKTQIDVRLFASDTRTPSAYWRWIFGGVVATFIIAVTVFFSPLYGPQDVYNPSLKASVAAEDRSLVVLVSLAAKTNTLVIDRQAGAALPGRVLELWLIVDGASAPVSLGVLPADTNARIALSDTLARQLAGSILAISDEPLGGSPTGAPTGDVLAAGPVTGA